MAQPITLPRFLWFKMGALYYVVGRRSDRNRALKGLKDIFKFPYPSRSYPKEFQHIQRSIVFKVLIYIVAVKSADSCDLHTKIPEFTLNQMSRK